MTAALSSSSRKEVALLVGGSPDMLHGWSEKLAERSIELRYHFMYGSKSESTKPIPADVTLILIVSHLLDLDHASETATAAKLRSIRCLRVESQWASVARRLEALGIGRPAQKQSSVIPSHPIAVKVEAVQRVWASLDMATGRTPFNPPRLEEPQVEKMRKLVPPATPTKPRVIEPPPGAMNVTPVFMLPPPPKPPSLPVVAAVVHPLPEPSMPPAPPPKPALPAVDRSRVLASKEIATLRAKLDLSLRGFATLFSVTDECVTLWEAGVAKPGTLNGYLLCIIAEAVAEGAKLDGAQNVTAEALASFPAAADLYVLRKRARFHAWEMDEYLDVPVGSVARWGRGYNGLAAGHQPPAFIFKILDELRGVPKPQVKLSSKRVLELRRVFNQTQEAFARFLGTTARVIGEWETKGREPQASLLERLRRVNEAFELPEPERTMGAKATQATQAKKVRSPAKAAAPPASKPVPKPTSAALAPPAPPTPDVTSSTMDRVHALLTAEVTEAMGRAAAQLNVPDAALAMLKASGPDGVKLVAAYEKAWGLLDFWS